MFSKKKKALVLAGGGSRGSYHIGVWTGLRELRYKPDIVCGTSVGALMGAAIVTNQYDEALEAFLNVDNASVMTIPEKTASFSDYAGFVADIVKGGGMDVSPLEKIVTSMVDEKRIRNSRCRFGLCTVKKSNLNPHEVTIDDIPEGKLCDYLLASAAVYPAFRPVLLEGEEYIDGGYFNNLPIFLADDMGATEVIAVDLEAVGFVRRYTGSLPVRYIRSYWPLGNMLDFKSDIAKRNMRLGYLDVMKSFKKYYGHAYTFKLKSIDRYLNHDKTIVRRTLDKIEKTGIASNVVISRLKNYDQFYRSDIVKLLAFAEITGEVLGLSPEKIYDFSEFISLLKQEFEQGNVSDIKPKTQSKDVVKTFSGFFETQGIIDFAKLAISTATMPSELIAAAFCSEIK